MDHEIRPKDRPLDDHLVDAVEKVEETAPQPNIGTTDTGEVEGSTNAVDEDDEIEWEEVTPEQDALARKIMGIDKSVTNVPGNDTKQ